MSDHAPSAIGNKAFVGWRVHPQDREQSVLARLQQIEAFRWGDEDIAVQLMKA